ncbi:IL1R1 isoform 13, partial [Pan troglodytes]
KCKEREEKIILVSSANEIDVRPCPLNPNEHKGTITWYKDDSKTPVSTEQASRIHQHKEKLWFVPAKVEDSGHYYCVETEDLCALIWSFLKMKIMSYLNYSGIRIANLYFLTIYTLVESKIGSS